MGESIQLGISTCPNDTFTFHALLNGLVDTRGLDFQIELLDIQELNDRLFADRFDVAKTSFHAALLLADRFVVLPSGSALGYGVGPLLLSADPTIDAGVQPAHSGQVTLCPGRHTTAMLLFSLFYPQTTQVRQTVFSDIMPQLINQHADFGVCIHEGRFTWQDEGLGLVEDLGARWEQTTGCPLPLGGLVASKRLSPETITTVQLVVRDSLEFALADRDAALPTMRKHAQEFDDDVLMQHVDLYVNEWTQDLGPTGAKALAELSKQAVEVGIIDSDVAQLEIASA